MTREEQITHIASQYAINETDGQNNGKAAAKQGGLRPAKDVAIEYAINMAVDMAERLEKRLKGGRQ